MAFAIWKEIKATSAVTVKGTLVVLFSLLTSTLKAFLHVVYSVFKRHADKPVLYYKPSHLNSTIVQTCKSLQREYHPPWWAINGHIETIASLIVGRYISVNWDRELVTLYDGGTVALDWVSSVQGSKVSMRECQAILLVLPGLTGAVDGYFSLYGIAHRNKLYPVIFNKRGHGGTKLSTPKLQCFGDPTDLRECICYISKKHPDKPVLAVGYSAGSCLLSHYLGTYPDNPLLAGAVHNSPGYDSEKLFAEEGGLRQPYNAVLTRDLKVKVVQPNKDLLEKNIDMEKVMNSSSLRQLEHNLYCRLYGFDDIDEYLELYNPTRILEHVTVPSLCINSKNDPICLEEYLPYDYFKEHDSSILIVTPRGGHCGWVENIRETWADHVAIDYLQSVLRFNNSDKSSSTTLQIAN